jgi:hypothetical protein
MGTSQYQDHPEDPLSILQIKNNIDRVYDILVDTKIVGVPTENIEKILNEISSTALEKLRNRFNQIKLTNCNILIFYYAGHGVKNDNNLLLFGSDTNKDNCTEEGKRINYHEIIDILNNKSSASTKILILDCCHAGGAFSQELLRAGNGSYTIVSTGIDEKACFSPKEQYTAFSGELINVLENGIDNNQEIITIQEIAEHIKTQLIKKADDQTLLSLHFNEPSVNIADNQYYLSLENKYFKDIAESLEEGRLIFFLGSGINYHSDNLNIEKLPPSDLEIAECLLTNYDHDLSKIIGLPCQVCPIHLDSRPSASQESQKNCFIWEEINKSDKKEQLKNEQHLAFAKLEIRCRSQVIMNNNSYAGLKTPLRDLFRGDYEPNEIQNKLANLAKIIEDKKDLHQFLILTTNYDIGLEKAFEKKVNFDVIYYYLEEKELSGKFWHKSYLSNNRQSFDNNKEKIDEFCQEIPIYLIDSKPYINKPIIFKLYGGVLHEADEKYDSFAIAESHLINYLQNPKDKLPQELKTYLTNSNILFLGCNHNDADLASLLYRFFEEKFPRNRNKEKGKGWLINPLKPGELNNKKQWENIGITLIDECSSYNFLCQLEKYLGNRLDKFS